MNKPVHLRARMVIVISLLLPGCVPRTTFNEEYVTGKIEERSGYEMTPVKGDTINPPPGVIFEDGLTEDEAVSLALWNNQQLKVDLAALGFAQADLIEAGIIPNPVFSLLYLKFGNKTIRETVN